MGVGVGVRAGVSFVASFVFNESNLNLQAIYKDVNNKKAYLLRLSSF